MLPTITTPEGWEFAIRSDGHRLWAKQISPLPLHHDYKNEIDGKHPIVPMPEGGWPEECVFEWKHSECNQANSLVEIILQRASGNS